MELLKKSVTILAIIGTVGITVLFLTYPMRTMIRGWFSSEVSLESEEPGSVSDAGTGEAGDEVLQEPVTEQSVIEQLGTVVPEPASFMNVDMILQIETTEGLSGEVGLWWHEDQNTGYFFLPAYASREDCEISLSGLLPDGFVLINGKRINEGDILRDIEWDKGYPLRIYDQNDTLVADTEVLFCSIENLPTIFIETESGSLSYVHENILNEERGQAHIYSVDGRMLFGGALEQFGGRGNTTWALEKKAYKFKLTQDADLFGMGTARTFALLANGYDETQLRNLLVLSMGEKAGMQYVPQGEMVSLYCNGEYQGNYFLCERVEIGEERLNIRNLEAEMRSVYQQSESDKFELIESEDGAMRWADIAYNPEDISGGYLIERELASRYEAEEACGFKTTQGDCYVIVSPQYASYEQVSYIAGLMQKVQDAAERGNGIHPETGRHYSEYIDMDSFVDKYLVDEISKNYDGGVTSSFFYKPDDRVSTKLFAGPLWDYDVAFGNCDLDAINSNPMGITMLTDHIYGTTLFRDLYQKAEFREAVVEGYRTRYRPILETMLEEQIGEYDRLYRQSIGYNDIRWWSLYNRYSYYSTHEEQIRYLRYFVEQRMRFLDEVWVDGTVYHCISLYVDDVLWKKMYVRDGEVPGPHAVPSKENAVFYEFTRDEAGGISYDEYRPVYSDMRFYAQWLADSAADTAVQP